MQRLATIINRKEESEDIAINGPMRKSKWKRLEKRPTQACIICLTCAHISATIPFIILFCFSFSFSCLTHFNLISNSFSIVRTHFEFAPLQVITIRGLGTKFRHYYTAWTLGSTTQSLHQLLFIQFRSSTRLT